MNLWCTRKIWSTLSKSDRQIFMGPVYSEKCMLYSINLRLWHLTVKSLLPRIESNKGSYSSCWHCVNFPLRSISWPLFPSVAICIRYDLDHVACLLLVPRLGFRQQFYTEVIFARLKLISRSLWLSWGAMGDHRYFLTSCKFSLVGSCLLCSLLPKTLCSQLETKLQHYALHKALLWAKSFLQSSLRSESNSTHEGFKHCVHSFQWRNLNYAHLNQNWRSLGAVGRNV